MPSGSDGLTSQTGRCLTHSFSYSSIFLPLHPERCGEGGWGKKVGITPVKPRVANRLGKKDGNKPRGRDPIESVPEPSHL